MKIIDYIRQIRNKLIRFNNYPKIKGDFTPIIFSKLRNSFYTYLFKKLKGSNLFYSEGVDFKRTTYLNRSKTIINKEFYENGITISNNFLPENELSIIKKSIEQLNLAIKNNVNDEKGLKDFYVDRTLPMFKTLMKNYYTSNTARRFSLSVTGERWASLFPTLFSSAKDVAQSIFNKKFKPKDFGFEIISEYSDSKESLGKINRAHVDRFFPAVKLIYSPLEITRTQSPFVYYKKSHLINDDYLKSMNDYIQKEKKDPSSMGLFSDLDSFKNLSPQEILTKPNDMILVATNGLHKRSGFKFNKFASRSLLFIDFYSFFKKTDLLF